jgi:2-isopropylmalate synthase
MEVLDYHEHALGSGTAVRAMAYVCLGFPDGKNRWGAGVDVNIELAAIKAVLSALNRE